jgi:hypothetical protein
MGYGVDKDLEETFCRLLWDTVTACVWRTWRKQRHISIKVTGLIYEPGTSRIRGRGANHLTMKSSDTAFSSPPPDIETNNPMPRVWYSINQQPHFLRPRNLVVNGVVSLWSGCEWSGEPVILWTEWWACDLVVNWVVSLWFGCEWSGEAVIL